jgi:hypothetical protein
MLRRVHLVRLITMIDLLFVVLLAKIAHTSVAVMASAITQFFGRSASSTPILIQKDGHN